MTDNDDLGDCWLRAKVHQWAQTRWPTPREIAICIEGHLAPTAACVNNSLLATRIERDVKAACVAIEREWFDQQGAAAIATGDYPSIHTLRERHARVTNGPNVICHCILPAPSERSPGCAAGYTLPETLFEQFYAQLTRCIEKRTYGVDDPLRLQVPFIDSPYYDRSRILISYMNRAEKMKPQSEGWWRNVRAVLEQSLTNKEC